MTAAAATEEARRKGKRKQHTEQNEALCHEQNWRAEAKICVHVQLEKEMTTQKNKESTFIILQKIMMSMHSCEKIEEMVSELEGYRWDAIFLSETWRQEQAEIWETHHKHIFMRSGKFDNKHGVGMMLNKRWRQRIIDTEYINERAITTTILVNRQHIKLMSENFPHSTYAEPPH